jgi:hypothetical protein
MIFLRFSLDTLDLKTDFLRTGPWVLRSSPLKDLRPRNVVPSRGQRRGNPKSGELVAGMDRGSGGD